MLFKFARKAPRRYVLANPAAEIELAKSSPGNTPCRITKSGCCGTPARTSAPMAKIVKLLLLTGTRRERDRPPALGRNQFPGTDADPAAGPHQDQHPASGAAERTGDGHPEIGGDRTTANSCSSPSPASRSRTGFRSSGGSTTRLAIRCGRGACMICAEPAAPDYQNCGSRRMWPRRCWDMPHRQSSEFMTCMIWQTRNAMRLRLGLGTFSGSSTPRIMSSR